MKVKEICLLVLKWGKSATGSKSGKILQLKICPTGFTLIHEIAAIH